MSTIKQNVVLDYIAKYPELPNRTLAHLMFSKEEGLFKDPEAARNVIRYYKGAYGEKSATRALNAGHIAEIKHSTVKEGLKKLGIVSRAEAPEHVILGEGRYLILSIYLL